MIFKDLYCYGVHKAIRFENLFNYNRTLTSIIRPLILPADARNFTHLSLLVLNNSAQLRLTNGAGSAADGATAPG